MDTPRSRTPVPGSTLALALLLALPWPALRGAGADSSPDAAAPGPHPAQREKHLANLGVTAWHAAGSRGQGVKVAVLDSGFRGYRTFLGKALPATSPPRPCQRVSRDDILCHT